jgi:hypothetical protein
MRRVIQAGRSLIQASSLLKWQAPSCSATSARLYSGETITCTLFPGDGIGPEIAESVKQIFEAAGAPIDWDEQYIGKVADPRTNSMVTRENLDSVLVGNLNSLLLPDLSRASSSKYVLYQTIEVVRADPQDDKACLAWRRHCWHCSQWLPRVQVRACWAKFLPVRAVLARNTRWA